MTSPSSITISTWYPAAMYSRCKIHHGHLQPGSVQAHRLEHPHRGRRRRSTGIPESLHRTLGYISLRPDGRPHTHTSGLSEIHKEASGAYMEAFVVSRLPRDASCPCSPCRFRFGRFLILTLPLSPVLSSQARSSPAGLSFRPDFAHGGG